MSSAQRTASSQLAPRVLVGIPPGRSMQAELMAAVALADRLHGALLAGYVTWPGFDSHDDAGSQILAENLALAERLGATVITAEAPDVASGLIAMAEREGITHAVFGHRGDPRALFAAGSIVATFAGAGRGVEVQVIGVPGGDRRIGEESYDIPQDFLRS